jgi:hypothetical protein
LGAVLKGSYWAGYTVGGFCWPLYVVDVMSIDAMEEVDSDAVTAAEYRKQSSSRICADDIFSRQARYATEEGF